MKLYYCESCKHAMLEKWMIVRHRLFHLTHKIRRLEYNGTQRSGLEFLDTHVRAVLDEYDQVAKRTGSQMELASAFIQKNPNAKIAVIDKSERVLDLQKKEGSRGHRHWPQGSNPTPRIFISENEMGLSRG